MTAYFIAQIRFTDRHAFRRYEEAFMDVFAATGGEILAVDEAGEVMEGDWRADRTVLIAFPDKAAARRWFRSDAYQAISAHRRAGSEGDIVLVEGFAR